MSRVDDYWRACEAGGKSANHASLGGLCMNNVWPKPANQSPQLKNGYNILDRTYSSCNRDVVNARTGHFLAAKVIRSIRLSSG
jgi:hypothetical protein